jgi:hypothetical protein
LLAAAVVWACGPQPDQPFDLKVEPEFVQGVIPGERCVLLATVEGQTGDGGPVALAALTSQGQVTVVPDVIRQGEVAEITVVPGDVGIEEIPIEVTVLATRGQVVREHRVSTVIVPWEDSISDTARAILGVFTSWLDDERPDLEIGPASEFEGTVVAPRLLVVTHYAFFSDEWEIGLAWHIMVPPKDWAQMYLRPRDRMTPTEAFELASWSMALENDRVEIQAIPPPEEVTR